MRYEILFLTEKNVSHYFGFNQGRGGYYMALFVNNIASLKFTRNIFELRFLKDSSMKTRPSKTKIVL